MQSEAMRHRKKQINSCGSCRRRKTKCDRRKPSCSACLHKRLKCEYASKNRRENSLKAVGISSCLPATDQRSCSNNSGLRSVSYVSKKNGKIIYYGPTSFRCAIGGTSLETHFLPIWSQIKIVRKKWKAEHQYSTQTNVNFISTSLSLITGGSVLEALCASLPDIALVKKELENFFASPFYSSVPLVDPFKVLESIDRYGVRNGRIMSFGLEDNKNYFMVAIITEILSITYFQGKLPPAVDLFHNLLLSDIRGKHLFVERVQFLMLRYIGCKIEGYIVSDDSTLRNLVQMAYTTSLNIGLHRVENYNNFKDKAKNLSVLWNFTLFCDFEISFSMGLPLCIPQDAEGFFVKQEWVEKFQDKDLSLFVDCTTVLRETIGELHTRTTCTDLEIIIWRLKGFYSKKFGPIHLSVIPEYNILKDFKVLIVKLSVLQVISNYSLLGLNLRGMYLCELQQNALICQLASMKMLMDNLKACFIPSESIHSDFFEIHTFAVIYCFHAVSPRATTELFSIIMKAALYEDYHLHSEEKIDRVHQEAKDFGNIFRKITFLQNGGSEKKIDSSTALALIQSLHEMLSKDTTKDLFEFMSHSYTFIISDSLIQLMSSAVKMLLEANKSLELSSLDSNTAHASLFEPMVDFFFDDDFFF